MFDEIAKQWGTAPVAPTWGGVDYGMQTPLGPGANGISKDLFNYLGLDYGKVQNAQYQSQWGQDKENFDPSASTWGLWNAELANRGLRLGEMPAGGTNFYQQLFDQNNNPVGPQATADLEQDPGGIFGAAVLGAAGFGAASALGVGAGAAADAGTQGATLADSGLGSGFAPMADTGFDYGALAGGPESAAGFGAGGGGELGSIGGTSVGGDGLMGSINGALGTNMTGADLLRGAGGIGSSLIGGYYNNKAIGAQKDATNQANALSKYIYDTQRADFAPYRNTGYNALGHLNNLMANPNAITQDPGYQFQLQQGQKALDNQASRAGNLYSGNQLKAASQYNTNFATTKLNDSYNRYGNVAQLGATGVNGTARAAADYGSQVGNNLTGLGNAVAGSSLYNGALYGNALNGLIGASTYRGPG